MKNRVFIVIILLSFTTVACWGCSNRLTTPANGPILAKQESANQLKQNVYQALAEAETNHEVQLRLNNEEITSLVTFELVNTGQVPLSNPQIWFADERVHIAGLVHGVGPVDLNAYIVNRLQLDEGQISIQVETAQLGHFSFPNGPLRTLTETVNEALTKFSQELEITNLEIGEGAMTITGKRPN